jgi:hypothetical protein
MPKTSAHGSSDGIFGFETKEAVKAFQGTHKLATDGLVGKQTLLALDKLMTAYAAKQAPAPSSTPAYRPPPRDANYMLGNQDPQLTPDPGAGPWNSRPKTMAYYALKVEILNAMPHAFVVIGKDAVKHMMHYLGNGGKPLAIDLESMLKDVPSALAALEGGDAGSRLCKHVAARPPLDHLT